MGSKLDIRINKEDFKRKLDIKDGKNPTKEELVSLITPLIPDAVPGKDYILTDEDKSEIAMGIEVPVVEKIIERTEVIKEQPIYNTTEVIKEVVKEITPEEISKIADQIIPKIEYSKIKDAPTLTQIETRLASGGLSRVTEERVQEMIDENDITHDTLQGVTDRGATTDNIITVPGVQFDVTATPATNAEGLLQWNATDGTLDLGMSGGDITLQIGQEQFVKVLNNTGVQIDNSQVVYINSASTGRPTIGLANSLSTTMARKTIGVLTQDIADGAEGFVTTFGKVRGIDTSAWTAGDTLYVSSTNGVLTNVAPTMDEYVVTVGVVLISDSVNGSIFVKSIQYEVPDELNFATGFPNPVGLTYGFVNGTRTLTLTPTGANYHFYQQGVQYRKTTDSFIISDTEGVHYVYYNLGVLSEIVNPTMAQVANLIEDYPTIVQIYWDTVNNLGILQGNELHGFAMSSETHEYLHFTRGSRWISGMQLNTINATGNGNTNSHAQFGVDAGIATDEDLMRNPSAVLSTAGLPIFYISGATPVLRKATQAGYPVLTDVTAGVGVTGRLVYNLNTAGTWSLATVPSTDFVLCHVFNTNDLAQPYITVIGQASYGSISSARTNAELEIGNILTVFPKEEWVPIATVIFQTALSYGNAVKARVVEVSTGVAYVDWRTTDLIAASGSTPTDHNSLSGKQGGTASEYYHLTNADYTSSLEGRGITKSLAYNGDGTLHIITSANGTKTLAYNLDGTLASITGTGIYKTKTFTYVGGVLTAITI